MPNLNNALQQYITEFHPDIVKAVPALPAAASYTGSRFHRTTDHLDYYSDGTRWLSVQEHSTDLPFTNAGGAQPYAQGSYTYFGGFKDYATNGVYLENLYTNWYHLTAQSGVNNYSVGLASIENTGGGTNRTITSGFADTSLHTTINRWYQETTVYNLALTNISGGVQVSVNLAGAPGSYYFTIGVTYRLIG